MLVSATRIETGKSAVALKGKGVARAEPGIRPGWFLGEHWTSFPKRGARFVPLPAFTNLCGTAARRLPELKKGHPVHSSIGRPVQGQFLFMA
jgi:hypothetical protein